jgi:hypothetical protein
MTLRQYKTLLLFFTLTEKKPDAGKFTQDLVENLKIVHLVTGLSYRQPNNCQKLVG